MGVWNSIPFNIIIDSIYFHSMSSISYLYKIIVYIFCNFISDVMYLVLHSISTAQQKTVDRYDIFSPIPLKHLSSRCRRRIIIKTLNIFPTSILFFAVVVSSSSISLFHPHEILNFSFVFFSYYSTLFFMFLNFFWNFFI